MIEILKYTTEHPISMIGEMAGICWGADTSNLEKNLKRGFDCLDNEHGRTFEFPDVYTKIDERSARVIREWYTHIGGAPTRLQESTRYVKFSNGFDYVTPKTILKNERAKHIYDTVMGNIANGIKELEALKIPREDSSMLLPLGMDTKIVDKRNFRNIWDMAHQRLCNRAYWEYRELLKEYLNALSEYSSEWKVLIDKYVMPKCEYLGECREKKTCGKMKKVVDKSV